MKHRIMLRPFHNDGQIAHTIVSSSSIKIGVFPRHNHPQGVLRCNSYINSCTFLSIPTQPILLPDPVPSYNKNKYIKPPIHLGPRDNFRSK